MGEYILNFQGYWRECNKGGLPSYAGIYVVYRAIYNSKTDRVLLNEIIYIGQANNIRERHQKHEKYDEFCSRLKTGEELCYSCAEVDGRYLDLLENALIFAQKPALNSIGKESYKHQAAHIKLDGQCACMNYTDFNIR